MKKKTIYCCFLTVLLTSCTAKSPGDFADEYNGLVSELSQTTDSAARNEIFRKMSEVQLDARGKLNKVELKEFLRLTDSVNSSNNISHQ